MDRIVLRGNISGIENAHHSTDQGIDITLEISDPRQIQAAMAMAREGGDVRITIEREVDWMDIADEIGEALTPRRRRRKGLLGVLADGMTGKPRR